MTIDRRQLVELYGGRVAAHNDGPRRGGEFAVPLPALPPARDEAPAGADQGKPAKGGRHILIIEDNADTLIDLGLPGADGTEVARKVRAELGDGVLLVALTGHALAEDRRRTQEAGFNVHLVKPVELEELTALLADPLPPRRAAGFIPAVRPDDASGNGDSVPPPP
jgi:CheY-like chemotaxis protein